MQNVNVQTSLLNVYENVCHSMEETPANFLTLLKEQIKLESLIPKMFYEAYNKNVGKPRDYRLESMLWFHQLQNIIGIHDDTVMLRVLQVSSEIREFCGFSTVPHEAQITRFRQNFASYLGLIFEIL